MEKELAVYCLMKWTAKVMNQMFWTALMVEGVNMIVPMGKMRVWNVVSRIQKSYIFPNLVYFPVSYTCNHYICHYIAHNLKEIWYCFV